MCTILKNPERLSWLPYMLNDVEEGKRRYLRCINGKNILGNVSDIFEPNSQEFMMDSLPRTFSSVCHSYEPKRDSLSVSPPRKMLLRARVILLPGPIWLLLLEVALSSNVKS